MDIVNRYYEPIYFVGLLLFLAVLFFVIDYIIKSRLRSRSQSSVEDRLELTSPSTKGILDIDQIITPNVSSRRLKVFKFLMMIHMLMIAVAAIASWVDIESIVFSGPIAGGLCYIFTLISGIRYLRLICLGTVIVSLGCLSTIYLLKWAPGDAEIPIASTITIYAVANVLFIIPKVK